jgi:hypothetical protein
MQITHAGEYTKRFLQVLTLVLCLGGYNVSAAPPDQSTSGKPQFLNAKEVEKHDSMRDRKLEELIGPDFFETYYEVWVAVEQHRYQYVWIYQDRESYCSGPVYDSYTQARDASQRQLFREYGGIDPPERQVTHVVIERVEVPPHADSYYFIERLKEYDDAADVAMVYEFLGFVSEVRCFAGTF